MTEGCGRSDRLSPTEPNAREISAAKARMTPQLIDRFFYVDMPELERITSVFRLLGCSWGRLRVRTLSIGEEVGAQGFDVRVVCH